jgi:hypothetical protein
VPSLLNMQSYISGNLAAVLLIFFSCLRQLAEHSAVTEFPLAMAGFLRRLTSDAGRSNTDLNRQAQPPKSPAAKSGTTISTPLYARFASSRTSLNANSTVALNSRAVSGPMPLNGNKKASVPSRQVRPEESMPTGHNPADAEFQYSTAIQNHSRKPSQTTQPHGRHTTNSSVTSVTTDKPLPVGPVPSEPSNTEAASTNIESNNQTSMGLAHPSYLNKKPLPQPLPEPEPELTHGQQTAPVRKPSFSLTRPRNILSSPQAGPSNSSTNNVSTFAASPTSTGLSYSNPALMHDSKDEAAPAPAPNHRQEYTLSSPPPTSILPPTRKPSFTKNKPPPAPQLNPGNHNLSPSPPPSSLPAATSAASLLDQRLKDRGLEPPPDMAPSQGVSMFASGAFANHVTSGRSASIRRNGNLPKLDLGSSQYKVSFHSPFKSLVESPRSGSHSSMHGICIHLHYALGLTRVRQVFMFHIWLLQNVCEVVIDILRERNPHLLNCTLNKALQSKDIPFTTSRPPPHYHLRP